MKNIKKILVIVMALSMLLTACNGKPKDAVAKVGNVYITEAELEKEFELAKKLTMGPITDEQLEELTPEGLTVKESLMKEVLNRLAYFQVLKNEFEKNKLEITDAKIEEYRQKIVSEFPDEETYKEEIEKMGLSEEDMVTLMSKQIIQEELLENYISQHKPTEEDINKFYEEHKEAFDSYDVSHILVDTEEEAKAIKKELDGGADFAEIAKAKSIDPGSGKNGGSLGSITMQTSFVQEFLDAVKGMTAGQVSDPVKSQFGYHIIKVNSIKSGASEFTKELERAASEAGYTEYLQGLQTAAKVEILKTFVPKELPKDSGTENTDEGKENTETENKTEEPKTEEPKTEEPKADEKKN